MRVQTPVNCFQKPAFLRTRIAAFAKTAAWGSSSRLRGAEDVTVRTHLEQPDRRQSDYHSLIAGLFGALFSILIFMLWVAPRAAHAQDMQIIAGSTAAPPAGSTYPPDCIPPVPGPIFICNAGWDEDQPGNWTFWDGIYKWIPAAEPALGHLKLPNAIAAGPCPPGSAGVCVYIADQNTLGYLPQIRQIAPNGTISTYALMPSMSTGGEYHATSLAVDGNGNVYYGDDWGNVYVNVQCLSSDLINAFVGQYSNPPPGGTEPEWNCGPNSNTTYPYSANAPILPFTPNTYIPGPGSFGQPVGALAVDANNNLYILYTNTTDPTSWSIFEYPAYVPNSTSLPAPIWHIFGSLTDPGTAAQSLAVDSLGNVYTVDVNKNQLLKIDPSNDNVTVVGSSGLVYENPNNPNQLTVDPHNNLYIITENGSLVVESNPVTQFATNIAGTGTNGLNAPGFSPPVFSPVLNDSFPALQTDINQANGIALGPNGILYIADTGNNLVRQVVLNPAGTGCQKCGPQSLTLSDQIPTGKVPSYSALNPATHQLYVDYPPSSNTVTVFSTVDDTVATNITIGAPGDILGPIAADSTNNLIYVGDSTENTVSVINGAPNQPTTNQVIATVSVTGSPFAIAVDPGLRKVYVLTSANVEVSVIELVNGAYPLMAPMVTPMANNPVLGASAITVDTFRQIVYVRFIGPNTLKGGGLTPSQNYSLAVIDPYTDTVTATPSISYGGSTDIATDSIAVDEGTGEVVVADGFDQYVRIYFPSTQAFSFYDPGFFPSHVAVDSINEVYYFADGYGDTAYLNNLTYTSGPITSTPDPGNVNKTCGPQGSVIGVDETTDQVYITTCDSVNGAFLHLYSGDLQGDVNPTATFSLGTPPISAYFTILVDSSNPITTSHSAYVGNSITNQIDVFNGPMPGARPTFTITTPTPLNFNLVQVGVPTTLPVTIQNNGSATLALTTLIPTILPATGIFQISQGNCSSSFTLASGASCAFDVTFTPAALGSVNGSIIFPDNAPDSPQTLSLTGTGVAGSTTGTTSVSVSPASLNFGIIPENIFGTTLSTTVTNTGASPLEVTSIQFQIGNSPDFSEVGDSCQDVQIAIAGSCTITVEFNPAGSDTQNVQLSGTLQITYNATAGTPQTVTVTGTPANPAQGYLVGLPGSFNFGNIVVDARNVTAQFGVENEGGAPLPVSSITVTGPNATDFQQPSLFCNNGSITSASLQTAYSSGYAMGDTGTIIGGNGLATYTVLSVGVGPLGSGEVLTFKINNPGLGYSANTEYQTTTSGSGTGFAVIVNTTGSTNVTPASSFVVPQLGTCQVTVPFSPTSAAGTTEMATLQITEGSPIGSQSMQLLGTSAELGPPAQPLTSPLLVSTDNSVPPNPAKFPSGGILANPGTSSVSYGGQFVAFSLEDTLNMPGPNNTGTYNDYLRNTCLGPNAGSNCEQGTSFVSIGPNGAACTAGSSYPYGSLYPTVDTTGQYVAFMSSGCLGYSTNQVFLYSVNSGTSSLVSTFANISLGVFSSPELFASPFSMDLSARYFAYETNSSTSPSIPTEIYWTDVCTGQASGTCTPSTLLASQDNTNSNSGNPANNTAEEPAISANGRFVAFASKATNLLNPLNTPIPSGSEQVYLRDTCVGAAASPVCAPSTSLISAGATTQNATSNYPSVSGDGRFVVFSSGDTSLIPAGVTFKTGTSYAQIYLRDTCYSNGVFVCGSGSPSTTLLSQSDNSAGNSSSGTAFISADGRLITFTSEASNLSVTSSSGVYDYDTCHVNVNIPVIPCPAPGLNALSSGGGPVDATDQYTSFNILIPNNSGYASPEVYVGPTSVLAPTTGTGSNVEVPLCDPTTGLCWGTATFSGVTSAGQTLGILNGIGPDPGYQLLPASSPMYLYVSTTAAYTGNVQICVNYGLLGISYSSSLELLHFVNGQPPVVIYPGTGGTLNASQICGTVTSLSPFALALPVPTINPVSLAGGTAGVAYASVPFTTTGGQGSVNVTESGNLPTGMTFTPGTSASLSGTPTEVGSFPITITATDSANNIGTENLALTVSCPTITVTPGSLTTATSGNAYGPVTFAVQSGGVAPFTFSATGVPAPLTFTSAGVLSGTPSQTGTFPITVYATDSNSCTGGVSVNLTVGAGVQKTTPLINWSNPGAITYGTALSATQLDAMATVNSTSIPGTFVYSPPLNTVLGAGMNQTLSVTFTPTDTVDYNSAMGDVLLTVNTAPLTVTANAASRAYGAANPAFTAMVTGAVNGDTFTETFATTATATSGVGTYPITITNVAGSDIADYSLTTNNGTLNVTTAPLTVTANAASRVYGAANPTLTANVVGAVNGDTITETLATTATVTSPVGPYPITVSNVTGTNFADYSVTTNNGTLTITMANSTVLLVPTVGTGATAGTEVLTANVSPGTSGVPTGTVTFKYSTTTLATIALNTETTPPTAVLSTPDLPFGSGTVTATYNGDTNFGGSANPANVSPSFTIGATLSGAPVSSVTLAAGQSSQITITATSLTGFDSQISFSCGSLPVYVHCQFAPTTIPATVPSTPPATTATSTLTVSVDSTNAALGKQSRIELATAAPLALIGLFSLLFGKRKRWTLYLGLVLLLTGVAGTLAGCTSSNSSSNSSMSNLPPAGSPVIMIEGTANGGVMVPLNFTVNITN